MTTQKTSAVRDPVRQEIEEGIVELMPSLRAFARSLAPNPATAEDLVQDAILKALSHTDSFEPGTNLRAWLFTIIRNHYYSQLRKRRREVEDADGKMAERLATGPNQKDVDFAFDFSRVVPLLGRLNRDQCDVLVAVGYAEMSYEEAAVALNTVVGTVKSRVNRGVAAIQVFLDEGLLVEAFDLSSWSTATRGIPHTHPYYPVACAYEELYAFLKKGGVSTLEKETKPKAQQQSSLDVAWQALLDSGALESEPTLQDLLRKR